MNKKRVLGLVLASLLLAREALADTLVLRDGTRLEGTIANREQLKAHPELQATISIVTDGPEALRRVAAQDVEYVVLEDDTGRLVIDPSLLRAPAPARPSPPPIVAAQALHPRMTAAQNFILGGLAIGVTGAAVKFGRDSEFYPDNAYNGTNYAMWAAGGILIGIGLAQLADSTPEPGAEEAGHSLSLVVDGGSLGIGGGWRVGF